MSAPADLTRLCREVYPRLVGALGLYVGDREVAEELAQEALLRAAGRWERVGRLEEPAGWVYRVAMNLARSWLRRRRAEARAQRRHGPGGTVQHDVDVADRQAVRAAITELPERQRAALVLRYYLQLPVVETAEQLGVSSDGVRSLTKRALAQLRETLDDEDLEETHDG